VHVAHSELHGTQELLPLKYLPPTHDAHSVVLGPVQVKHVQLQIGMHTLVIGSRLYPGPHED
jgi:hypothetical protein